MKLALLALALCACTPAPSPVAPLADATDGAPQPAGEADAGTVHLACVRLRELACSEGYPVDGGKTCDVVFLHAIEQRIAPFDAQCVADARTQEEARRCPGIGCGR